MNKKIALLIVIIAIAALGLFSQQFFRIANFSTKVSIPENTKKNTGINTEKRNTINLSNQGLEKLPADVLKMTDLEELDISNNNLIGALPAEIHDLRNLRILNASDNLITGVPAEVGQLQNLEVLDLSNNRLTGLPYELGNLKKLKRLNLSGNDYSKQDLEVIKKGLSPQIEIIY